MVTAWNPNCIAASHSVVPHQGILINKNDSTVYSLHDESKILVDSILGIYSIALSWAEETEVVLDREVFALEMGVAEEWHLSDGLQGR